jgi:hypothetical protein
MFSNKLFEPSTAVREAQPKLVVILWCGSVAPSLPEGGEREVALYVASFWWVGVCPRHCRVGGEHKAGQHRPLEGTTWFETRTPTNIKRYHMDQRQGSTGEILKTSATQESPCTVGQFVYQLHFRYVVLRTSTPGSNQSSLNYY